MISSRSATETRARLGLKGVRARSAARRIDRSAPRAPRARRAHRARRPRRRGRPAAAKTCANSAGEPSRRSSTRRAALWPQSGSRSGSPTSARVRDGRGGAPARGVDRIRSGVTVGVPVKRSIARSSAVAASAHDASASTVLASRPSTGLVPERTTEPTVVVTHYARRVRRATKTEAALFIRAPHRVYLAKPDATTKLHHVVQKVGTGRRPLGLYAVRGVAALRTA